MDTDVGEDNDGTLGDDEDETEEEDSFTDATSAGEEGDLIEKLEFYVKIIDFVSGEEEDIIDLDIPGPLTP